MNAIDMITLCAVRQQADALYVLPDNIGYRGLENVSDTPMVAAPSDTGIEDHGGFEMEGAG